MHNLPDCPEATWQHIPFSDRDVRTDCLRTVTRSMICHIVLILSRIKHLIKHIRQRFHRIHHFLQRIRLRTALNQQRFI